MSGLADSDRGGFLFIPLGGAGEGKGALSTALTSRGVAMAGRSIAGTFPSPLCWLRFSRRETEEEPKTRTNSVSKVRKLNLKKESGNALD